MTVDPPLPPRIAITFRQRRSSSARSAAAFSAAVGSGLDAARCSRRYSASSCSASFAASSVRSPAARRRSSRRIARILSVNVIVFTVLYDLGINDLLDLGPHLGGSIRRGPPPRCRQQLAHGWP